MSQTTLPAIELPDFPTLDPQVFADALAPFRELSASLDRLAEQYAEVPDASTPDGYEAAKRGTQALTKLRTGVDKARLAVTKPHREHIQAVNDAGKALVSEIERIERPWRDEKQAADEAAERAKAERQERLRQRIDTEIRAYLDTAEGLDSNDLARLIDQAEALEITGYYDVSEEAARARMDVVRRLGEMHAQALAEESLAAERAELDRQRAELERLRAAVPEEADTVTSADFDAMLDDADDGTSYDEAVQDLIAAGLDGSSAVEAMNAICGGRVRHVTYS